MSGNKSAIEHHQNLFIKSGFVSMILVFCVILAGSVVRATGSGMGCPDWPKCFGLIVPPTEVSQLPADYQVRYQVAGKPIEEFNVYKTWTEYVNRLVSVILGLTTVINLYAATRLLKTNKWYFVLALTGFALILFVAWLGKLVVSSNLMPGMITIHMSLAILIAFIYMTQNVISGNYSAGSYPSTPAIRWVALIAFAATVLQLILGTRVREGVDELSSQLQGQSRGAWLDAVGLKFYIHRSFSILILILNVVVIRFLTKNIAQSPVYGRLALLLALALGIEIIAGIVLAYFELPAILQPVHLLSAAILVTALLNVILLFFSKSFSLLSNNVKFATT